MKKMKEVKVNKSYQKAVGLANKRLSADAANWVRDEHIRSCTKMVVEMACKYAKKSSVDVHDLISEGNLGVCVAWDKWVPERGAKFSSVAYMWARAYMINFLKKNTKFYDKNTSLDELLEREEDNWD